MVPDLIHDIMNILFPPITLIFLLLFFPPFLVYKFLRYLKRSILAEDLKGKVVLITGASSGIGEHVAYEYARRGARLILAARREERLRKVADRAQKLGSPEVLVVCTDVSNPQDCKQLIHKATNQFGKLNHLVNNAGIERHALFEAITQINDFAPVMDINFWGSAYCTHFALPHLRKNKGKIIVISSIGSWTSSPGLSFYNASKAALVSLYETLRTEFGSDVGITIVLPGVIESEITNAKFLSEIGIDNVPMMTTTRCAKAIVRSACRGDMYLTEPYWAGVMFLLKVLFPELHEWSLHRQYVKKPGKHRSI